MGRMVTATLWNRTPQRIGAEMALGQVCTLTAPVLILFGIWRGLDIIAVIGFVNGYCGYHVWSMYGFILSAGDWVREQRRLETGARRVH